MQALHALMKDDTDVLCMLGMLRMLQDKHESAADAFAAAVRLSMVSLVKCWLAFKCLPPCLPARLLKSPI